MGEEKDIMEMFKWIEEKFGQLDLCICNAGFGDGKPLLEGNYSEWRKMMDVNVLSLNLCTQQSIKMMQKHEINDGQILFINSDSGHNDTNSLKLFMNSIIVEFKLFVLNGSLLQPTRSGV